MCVVAVRVESALVEGEREKIPFSCLGLTDCEGMIERGNEVGSGYANACLLSEAKMPSSTRAVGSCCMISRCHLSNGP